MEGMTGFDRGLVLDVNPVITQKATGAPSATGWTYNRPHPEIGGSLRYGVTNNLTLTGTANPDFAEVESDAGQFVIDPRQALYFPEKRPFFLEGLEQFSVPSNLIYTRRIAKPDAAAKLTGKLAGTTVGFLSASDDQSLSPSGRDATLYNILRAQRDIGTQSRIGMAYTDRVVAGDYNRVGDVDGRATFGDVYSAAFQYAESYDKTGDRVRNAPLWNGTVARNGKQFGFRYSMSGLGEDFRASSGFISRAGVAHGAIDHRWTWFNERGSIVEALTGDVLYDDTWQYSHLLRHGDAQDKKFHLSTTANLRGGWSVGAGVYWETFGWDSLLYANYRIERTVGAKTDTIPFTGIGRIPNRDYVFTLNTPQWSKFDLALLYVGGQDENFFEWAQANIDYVSLGLDYRPTDHLRANATLNYQDYWRRSDHSLAGRNVIPRVKVEYQFTQAIFFRVVGEYDLAEHDDLRDETRTFLPLIIGGRKALATRSAQFHTDLLFSYQPSPGTVLFVGYGGLANAPPNPLERFNFQPLVRSSDYVFAKFSYLFRL
jgi:hypothetical protein